jgi:hypothetical protein
MFDHWWMYPLVYLAGCWLVTVMMMRFGPRECPYLKSVVDRGVWRGDAKGYEDKKWIRHFTDDECAKGNAAHLHYALRRESAILWGIAWPLAAALSIPAMVIGGFVLSIAWAGEAEWLKDIREGWIKQVELARQLSESSS